MIAQQVLFRAPAEGRTVVLDACLVCSFNGFRTMRVAGAGSPTTG
jgi:hypothetical protein